MAEVEHPNVVPIYASPSWNRVCSTSRCATWRAARSTRCWRSAGPRWRSSLDVLADVAEGLDHCHARGIVHRDLKPANVLVDAESGRGLLTDFGIALRQGLLDDHRPGQPARHARLHGSRDVDGRPRDGRERPLGARRDGLPRGHRHAATRTWSSRRTRNRSRRHGATTVSARTSTACSCARSRATRRAATPTPAPSSPICVRRSSSRRPDDLDEAVPRRPGRPACRGGSATRRLWSVAGAALSSHRWWSSASPRSDDPGSNAAGGGCHPSYTGACLKAGLGRLRLQARRRQRARLRRPRGAGRRSGRLRPGPRRRRHRLLSDDSRICS